MSSKVNRGERVPFGEAYRRFLKRTSYARWARTGTSSRRPATGIRLEGFIVTTRYLLDTSIVSSPFSSKQPNPEVLKQLEEHGHECAIAAPVWQELTFGCQRLPRGKRRDAIEIIST